LKPPSFIYAASRAEEPDKLAKFPPSSETWVSKLPRIEKKLRVALDWTLDLFFSKDFVQYGDERAATISTEHQ
jgi:hypothetical protein